MNTTLFSWYLDITPIQMFSLYDYPIPGKCGLPLCEKHGRQLEQKEVVIFDIVATEASILTITGSIKANNLFGL